MRDVPGHPYEQGLDLKLWLERLELPLQWCKPHRIFVNSMSDLFHKDVSDEYIRRVFDIMVKANWHISQVLFDIELFRQQAWQSNDEDIWHFLTQLRERKNQVFQESIPEKTEELIS